MGGHKLGNAHVGWRRHDVVPVPLVRLDALCDPQRARVELGAWSLACMEFGISEAELRESMRSVEAELKSARKAGASEHR
jgi:hypothetical protein